MIIYKMNPATLKIDVFVDGKKTGFIDQHKNGWAYFPRGGFSPGEVFPTIKAVKRSLECE